MSNKNQLLLQDLSARLPYEVKVLLPEIRQDIAILVGIDDKCFTVSYDKSIIHCPFGIEIKPYLRPLSSMTDSEKQEQYYYKHDIMYQGIGAIEIYMNQYINWLDSNHFDWRMDGNNKTLIEKDLALKAPEGMYVPELAESEDEKVRKEIIQFLQLPHPQFVGKRDHEKWIAWLEKQKQEWSEEDENCKNALIGLINEIKNQPLKRLEDWDCYLNWLKSLKDRCTWKPSDEQIKVLGIFADNMVEPYYKGVILDLLEQLKVL